MRSSSNDLLIVDVVLDLNGYNYYAYMSSGSNSRYRIMRENSAQTEYKYAFGVSESFASDWANKENLNYIRPNELNGIG